MILFFCRFVKALGESSGNLTCLLKFCLIFSSSCQSSTQQCSRQTDRTETDGNTAQRASGDFARHLLANFPSEPVSYLPARICRTIFVRYCRIYFAGKWSAVSVSFCNRWMQTFVLSIYIVRRRKFLTKGGFCEAEYITHSLPSFPSKSPKIFLHSAFL